MDKILSQNFHSANPELLWKEWSVFEFFHQIPVVVVVAVVVAVVVVVVVVVGGGDDENVVAAVVPVVVAPGVVAGTPTAAGIAGIVEV